MAQISLAGTDTEQRSFKKILQGAGTFFKRIADPSGDKALESLKAFKARIAAKEKQLAVIAERMQQMQNEADGDRARFHETLTMEDFEKLVTCVSRLDTLQRFFGPEWSRANNAVSNLTATDEAREVLLNALRVIQRRLEKEIAEFTGELIAARERRGLGSEFSPEVGLGALQNKLQELSGAVGRLSDLDSVWPGFWQGCKHLHEHV